MRTLTTATASRLAPFLLVRETESLWAALAFGGDVPPATLEEARAGRSALARLLERERAAAADFLLTLADFDRRRGWERLGHASLFAFLTRELGLSKGAAYLRLSAARLLPRHPMVEAALRRGDLCLSAVGELARVLTPKNETEVLPRFFRCSSREARAVAAAILPAATPPMREVVTRLPLVVPMAPAPAREVASTSVEPASVELVRAHEPPRPSPAQGPAPSSVEPLTADLRRLHLTVSRGFLDKVAAARTGLSHALPGASTEQVLEAALDLLLAKQAQRKGMGRRALRRASVSTPTPTSTSTSTSTSQDLWRPNIPADLARTVRLRDGDSCQYPLDAGDVCGSTWQVELDHMVPVAMGGETSEANLRCLCRRHNALAAREELGEALMRGLAPRPRPQ